MPQLLGWEALAFFRPAREVAGDDRWQQLLEQPLPAGGQTLPHLVNNIQAFIGDSAPFDDMTLLVVRRL